MKVDKIFLAILFVFLVSNVTLSTVLITRSLGSQKQRTGIQNTVERFECILLIQPADRTHESINKNCGDK